MSSATVFDMGSIELRLAANGNTVSQNRGISCVGNRLNAFRRFLQLTARHNWASRVGDQMLTNATGPAIQTDQGTTFMHDLPTAVWVTIAAEG